VSGQFLSSFLVRNCDNWRGTSWKHDSGSTDPERSPKRNVQRAAAVISATGLNLERDEPSLASLHQQQLDEHIPRWLWDERMYPEAEIKTVVKAVQGHEDELGTFPVFTSTQKVVRIRKPRWRQLHPEWEHGLERIMDFLPGTLWIEPEMWMQPKGRKTDFHYDYDPVNLVFQVKGSRRFHFIPPQSAGLAYRRLVKPHTMPIDYGTRWADLVRPGIVDERVVDLKPKDVLFIPNGWLHRVTYTADSIGYAVRSWSQCQALSLWLGQRLCLLSSMLGSARMCFDDEHFREFSGYADLEKLSGTNLSAHRLYTLLRRPLRRPPLRSPTVTTAGAG